MVETYRLVGSEPTWITAVMPIPALIVWVRQRRKAWKHPAFTWQMGLIALWFIGCSLSDLPMEWIMGGATFVLALIMLTLKPDEKFRMPIWMRIALPATMAATGFAFFCMAPSILRERIVLTDQSVSFSSAIRSSTVPRSGLRVHATYGGEGWILRAMQLRSSCSWTSFSGDDLGPDVMGSQLYLGPHGLIRADDLGKRLAAWAGTKPKYQSMDDRARLTASASKS